MVGRTGEFVCSMLDRQILSEDTRLAWRFGAMIRIRELKQMLGVQ